MNCNFVVATTDTRGAPKVDKIVLGSQCNKKGGNVDKTHSKATVQLREECSNDSNIFGD